ncbi:MAG: hypothetical protein A2142_08235 [candidate division Zixibacteria bacterium RBG_16_48_11]|nr:MAG: hypothetical protein A2142_08235 [candidate division Zixibacteria bacterium RBG_16_48_11]
MRQQLPLTIIFVIGVFMALQYFVPHQSSEFIYEYALDWVIIIGVFAMALGLWSLFLVHFAKIQKKSAGWGYSTIAILGLVYMLIAGALWGIEEGSPFMKIFWYIYTPIQATMFALLAFYIASAAYRAFRVRNILSTILLSAALLLMLRLIPIGPLSGPIQDIDRWILGVPNLAAKRAIIIGVGLGIVATAIKVVLGIERSYLGKD